MFYLVPENPKDHIVLSFLARNANFFRNNFDFFSLFPSTFEFNRTAILIVWASLESNSQIPKCSSADLKTAKKPLPLTFFGLNRIFFCIKLPLFVSTPWASIRAVVLWVWVSLVWHKKIPKSWSAYMKTHKKNILLSFFGPKGVFSA